MISLNNKSQSMSINVIIVAVLALIVLVVLAAIFTGRIKIFSETLESCSSKQGQCQTGLICPENSVKVKAKCPETDEDKNQGKNMCCVQVIE